MKRVLIILCLLFVAFVSYSQQPYDYYRPITSDSIAVDSNLYINNIGMNKSAFIQYSVDSLIWSEERMNGWKYYRFSNDLKQTWSKAISLTYQLDSVEFVEIDPKGVARVSVLGTNTKTINIILRDSTNISTSFVDLVSEEGLGDDWGSDVVNSDITLLGNGTLGDVLRVDTTLIATKASVQQLSEITESEITAGSSSTLRSISGRRAAFIAERNKGTANPQPLGSSSVGVSVLYSRQDHVHPMPTIEVLGLVSVTNKAVNDILQWNGTNWVNKTLSSAGIQPTLTTGNLTENITGLEFSQTRMVIGGATELRLTTGYTIPTTTQASQWSSAYNDKINSAAFSGTTTKTLTLTQQDEGVVTASFTDNDNQTLSFTSPSLSISGGNSVNLSSINTDNQTLALDSLERVFTLSISNGNSVKWKDNDTQYTEISESEITSGISSTLRTISGRRAAFIAERNKGTATPLSLGSASVGTSILYSRQDHVHPMPSIESLNLVSISGKANNHILQWDGLNWINRSLFDAGIQPTLTTGNLTESIEGLEFSATRQVIGGSANLQLSSGYIIPTITQESNWTSGYNDKINSAAFSGTTTKTLTLTQQDGGTVTANFSDINTTYQNDVTDSGVGALLELKGSDSSSDFTYFNSGYGVDVLYTDASTMTFKADTSKLATQYDLTQIGGGGSSPGGTGTELQYRLNSTTFGGLTGSSVSGSNITLGGSLGMDYSLNNWMMLLWNRHSTSALGLAVLAGQNSQEREIAQFNSAQGLPVFAAYSNGKVRMESLPSATQTNVLYIDANGFISKGAAGGGSGSPLTTKGDIYTYSTGNTRLPVGTNGQILSANSATTTGLQWINPPSGSSIWTDAGVYAHLNGYEDIYMPFDKSISWRTTSGSVTGNNLFKIVGGTSALEFKAGSSDVLAMSLYNNNQAYLSSLQIRGSLSVVNGSNSGYEDDQYTIATFSANQNAKFGLLGGGTLAQVARSTSPSTPASGWGYWYVKADGKPYFKNSTGTEYDLTSGSGGGMTNPMTTQGDIIVGGSAGTPSRLAAGTSTYVLTSNGPGQLPSWQPSSGGGSSGVTSFSAGTTGLTPNTATQGDVTLGGTLNVGNGGTGRTTHTAYALIAGGTSSTGVQQSLSTGSTGQILRSNGSSTLPSWTTATYPTTTTANQALYSSANNTVVSGTLPVAAGGTNITSYTIGDIIYASESTTLSKLSAGVSGYILTSNGSGQAPSWQAAPSLQSHNLTFHSDVTISSPINYNILSYNGSSWVNRTPTQANLADLSSNQVIGGEKSFELKPTFPQSSLSSASMNITPGDTPTSPIDGDVWLTSIGVYSRINGVTKRLDEVTQTPTTKTSNLGMSINLEIERNIKWSTNTSRNITFSNIQDGSTGNIEVIYTGTAIVTFIVPSNMTLYIADNIYNATVNAYTKSVLSRTNGTRAIYSYYVSGLNVYVNGTQIYY